MTVKSIVKTPSAYDFPLLIKQLLTSPIARASENEIVCGGQRYGYPELVARIGRLTSALEALGVKPGQTVSVIDWDTNRYFESYFTIPVMGCVLHTVNVRLSPDQILYTINHAGAEVVFCSREFVPLLEQLLPKLATAKLFILLNEPGAGPLRSTVPFAADYESLVAEGAPRVDFPDFDENTHATIFYTSGTTGLPKGVYYSHRQMVLHAMGFLATFGSAPSQGRFHADDVYMPITPLFHAHAWGVPYAATMLGVKQVFPGRYSPDSLLALIKNEKVTFSHCVSTLLHMILTHPDAEQVDLRGVKFLIGGGALPRGLAKRALERGIDICTGYGMSETGPLQITGHLTTRELRAQGEQQIDYRIRAGRPVFLCDVRVADDSVKLLPRDGKSIGEVVFRSPWLTMGYYNNAQTSEQLWRGGWMHSGDMGIFNPDGSLQIADRIKDVIKTGGEWVSSLDIENLISEVPGVGEVAVIGAKDEKWGERPLALVVRRVGSNDPDAEAVRAHLQTYAEKGAISRYAVPDQVLFVDALDKTSVGKLDKKVLRTKYDPSAA